VKIHVLPDAAGVAERAAAMILEAARDTLNYRRRFTIALAGGGTPRATYEKLAAARDRDPSIWLEFEVFWGDERCVPPRDPDSNYRMACEALLDRVSIPPERIHRIRGEVGPERAREEYEEVLDRAFPEEPRPRFDLILLGLGEDGHTASLFPGSDALDVRGVRVTTAVGPKPPPERVTLTLPVLNAARRVIFVATGEAKREAFWRVWASEVARPAGEEWLPASLVRPEGGAAVSWVLDEAAHGGGDSSPIRRADL
jgi:6-phosphogluconolactonase